ncbi:MAG: phosphoglucosamine mutase [Gemmatimonadota bacterium]
MSAGLIVSASGIRGIVADGLTPEVAARYGASFATFLTDRCRERRGRYVIVGRDSRRSGPLLADAASAGLRGAGLAVHDLGVVATPTALLAAEEDDLALGALLITASHNPVEWNGLKLAGPEGRFLDPESGREVQRLFETGPRYREWDALGDRQAFAGAAGRHVERILGLSLVDPVAVAERGFRVALDCVRGAGGPIMSELLERLGCTVLGVDMEPDGRFPRNPEPTAEHLGGLCAAVREGAADLGMAVDPDVDRLSLVDEGGHAIGEDWTLALAVELVLAHRDGPVVTNLSSSRSIADAAARANQPFHRAPVGEANVVARMLEVSAVVGGEGNGGVILPELHLTRDAPLAAALVLQLLAERRTRIRELLAGWKHYRIAKRRMACPAGPMRRVYDALAEAAPGTRADRQDGLRLDWPEGPWVHVRPSGTEPILRIVAEAAEEAAAERLAEWAMGVVAAER